MASRQYRWALKQKAAGNCVVCGKKAVNNWYCQDHVVIVKARKHKVYIKWRDAQRQKKANADKNQ